MVCNLYSVLESPKSKSFGVERRVRIIETSSRIYIPSEREFTFGFLRSLRSQGVGVWGGEHVYVETEKADCLGESTLSSRGFPANSSGCWKDRGRAGLAEATILGSHTSLSSVLTLLGVSTLGTPPFLSLHLAACRILVPQPEI